MSESDELEEIRRQRREELERQLAGAGAADAADDADAGASAPTEPIHVGGSDHLADLTADHDVVLVDFYADWCGPCRMLEPVVESLAAETPAAVAKVDVDANGALASQYGVRGVPMLLLFADGDVVEQLVGVKERSQLEGLIEQYV
jgi:thioredoxin 1